MVAGGWGRGELALTDTEFRASLEGDRNVLELGHGDVHTTL